MKVQVIYSSRTGSTRRLAQAIFAGMETEEKSIHNLENGRPELDGDILLLGYWGIGGEPNEEMRNFLASIEGKTVGIFCTLGYYADSAHAWETVRAGVRAVEARNRVLGSFVCNGAVAAALMEGQGKTPGGIPTEQKELRWEMTRDHPTEAECALAVERFRERIRMYRRARELGIPFQSIL